MGGIMLFIACLGNVMGKVPRNFYVGIRTTWTLADERVWHSTHRLAGRLMVAAGILGFLAVALAGWWVAAAVILGLAFLIPIFYSLIDYKRLERQWAISVE